jgi:murein L,D-transpeptidase YcbB/YkuD
LERGFNPGLRRYTPRLKKDVAAFYASRDYAPIWTDAKAQKLIASLRRAGDHGLIPGEYGVSRLAQTPTSKAIRELLLSAAAALYAIDLGAGRFEPRRINREVHLSPIRVTASAVLKRLSASTDISGILASLAPQRNEYKRLLLAYGRYRAIAATGGWPRIPVRGRLRPGSVGPAVMALRRRLAATRDLPPKASEATAFDESLIMALKRYQRRNGLFVTGSITALDLEALNRTARMRVLQLRANLERRRWMQNNYGARFILVNQADFMVKLVARGKTIYTSKIIIGTRRLRTPVFRAEMNLVGFNPVWNVPASITRNELLPALRRNPKAYLRRRGMTLHDPRTGRRLNPNSIDWAKVRRGHVPFRLRQSPGRRNALGRIKFMFPNPYNVYLHDTPTKSLFKRRVRCFSHGCMRLADPVGLAYLLLRDQGWTRKRIKAAIGSGKRISVPLLPTVPVHIAYLSAWVNKNGMVHFREDVYGRDHQIVAAFTRIDRLAKKRQR